MDEKNQSIDSQIGSPFKAPAQPALKQGYTKVNTPQHYAGDEVNPTEALAAKKAKADAANAQYMKDNHVDANGQPVK